MADQILEAKPLNTTNGEMLIHDVYGHEMKDFSKKSDHRTQESSKEAGSMNVKEESKLDLPAIDTDGWGEEPSLSDTQQSLLDSAKDAVAKEMWDFGPNAKFTMEGKLGGATSVAHIADLAGLDGLESASVQGLSEELVDEHGFKEKPLSEGKPGDIMIDRDRHRMGIIGENGRMYHMDRQGTWQEMPLTKSLTARAYSKD